MTQPEPSPFSVEVPEAELHELRRRLGSTRWADDFANDGWVFGVPTPYLQELVEYWIESYDWRSHEAAMNEQHHWRVTIDGIPVHYMHVPGHGPDPFPLVLTHGWPWTFWDYRKVLTLLTDPGASGGDPADAFELVVPSLPGYGFSTPLSRPGIGFTRTADLWHTLMHHVLGYERYGAGGGDWGAFVSAQLAHLDPDGFVGAYLTFPALLGADLAGLGPQDYGPAEAGWFEQTATAYVPQVE